MSGASEGKLTLQAPEVDLRFSIPALKAIPIWSSSPGCFVPCCTDGTHLAAVTLHVLPMGCISTHTPVQLTLINKQTLFQKDLQYNSPFMFLLTRFFLVGESESSTSI